MAATLAGKWVWLWNWRRCDDGDPSRVAERLRRAGCRGALVKAHDGPFWFDQGRPWRELARALRAEGLLVGGWGYFYGRDVAGETRRAMETATFGEADLLVLDVEGEFKENAAAALTLCHGLRRELGASYPVYFTSFALARHHRSFPFRAFIDHCQGAVPQVYWNAFRRPPRESLALTYEDYATYGLSPQRLYPVAGLYREGSVPYPSAEEVALFAAMARERGSPGISFWSYEHMDAAMWEAVAAVPWPLSGEEETMDAQYDELVARVAALEGRVAALEGRLGQAPPAGERYHVVGPEGVRGLWGVAEHLGVPQHQIPAWIEQVKVLNRLSGPNPIIHQGDRLRIP